MQNNPWIRWSQRIFFVTGILALGYTGFVLLDTRLYQADLSRQFQEKLNSLKASAISNEHVQVLSVSPGHAYEGLLKAELINIAGISRALLGRIEISNIGLSAMILEGTDAPTLRRAVGHIPGTPLPGQRGNVAITGHRDTFFRSLRNIRKNDEIRLTTLSGAYRYGVDSIKVVKPEDTAVLNNTDDSILTLVTCYPFYYAGPAPKRFIVRAHMIHASLNMN
jgi:sortase A